VWSLRTAKIVIIFAGCLGMAYTQLTSCAAAIKYIQTLGGGGLHVGIFNALPTGMLFMQFVAAYLANSLKFRRRWWFWVTIAQRLIMLPFALGPWLFPQISDIVWLWTFLGAWAINNGMTHFSSPLWLSWMGDYLPKEGLNSFWGTRHLWMQLTAAASLLGGGIYLLESGVDARIGYAVMVVVATVLGVIDILMFYRVEEPPVVPLPRASFREILSGPFKHPGFRSFISFTCFWHVAAMIGAPFISLYLLEYIGMSLFQLLLLWTSAWVGGAISSRWLGHLAETYGNRPILIICTTLKSINMIALLVVQPGNVWQQFYWMVPVFMIDMTLNTGIAIANNGFLLKNSPAANRTMFIAAGTAVAGLCGGVTSIICGGLLTLTNGASLSIGSYQFNGFHALFLASLLMRLVAVALVRRVKEPDVHGTMRVVTTLIGVGPIRMLLYPVGLYRSRWADEAKALKRAGRGPTMNDADITIDCEDISPVVSTAKSAVR